MPARLLIVEDDPSHLEILRRHLARSGYTVEACESAEQALSVFHRFDPDLVLSDLRMPGMSGFELLRKLRTDAPDTVVVLMTAYDDMQTAIDAMKDGAHDYLVKPLDLDRLEEIVRSGLAARKRDGGGHEPAELADLQQDGLVGHNRKMVEVFKSIGRVAASSAPVLIRGETGTGKELIARTIHHNSRRAESPFVSVNCASLPETLLESELFGHVKGAFTGAQNDRKGRFEIAGAGTIFLDEIGDTSPAFQAKLLRVLQEKEFYPVGGERPRRSEARVLAATHQPIERLVREGRFREDLYFRLRVVEIAVPPLRERRDDIAPLARHLVSRAAHVAERAPPRISDAALKRLVMYDWPGNVRELENALTRAVVLAVGDTLRPEHLDLGSPALGQSGGAALDAAPDDALDDVIESTERAHVQRVLVSTGGHKSKTAEILGISRGRLDRIIEKHGLVTE
ncbi:MAG: sigma-54-dependent transcriptional regulator [Gemmatimonadota bacterium]